MDERPIFARVRLTGQRFEGGVLPIDSLIELQRYQDLVRKFASSRQAPGEEAGELRLVIERIDEGSADIFLALEQITAQIEAQTVARDQLEVILAAAYGDEEVSEDLDWDLASEVAQLGSTLTGEQALIVEPVSEGHPRVEITVVTRERAAEKLNLTNFMLATDQEKQSALAVVDGSVLAGRIVELDADKQTFRFESSQFGEMNGRYLDAGRTPDFRAVLDSSALAPVTRLEGALQYRNGDPWRIRDVQSLERLDLDDQSWATRLKALAELAPGWGDSGSEPPIAIQALEVARELLSALTISAQALPGVFPTEDGGVSLEWATAQSVRSIEITPEGIFEMFLLAEGDFEGAHSEAEDLPTAIRFALGGEA